MILRYLNIGDLSEDELGRMFLSLPEKRREEMAGVRNAEMRNMSLAGEILARKTVSELTGADPFSVRIIRDGNGKPSCGDNSAFFSISHKGRYAVCAADRDHEIGVDIEKIECIRPGVAKRFFSVQENRFIFGEEEKNRDDASPETCRRFFEVWTLKEAFVKNTGEGIAGIRRLELLFTDAGEITGSPAGYAFSIDRSISGYTTGICISL